MRVLLQVCIWELYVKIFFQFLQYIFIQEACVCMRIWCKICNCYYYFPLKVVSPIFSWSFTMLKILKCIPSTLQYFSVSPKSRTGISMKGQQKSCVAKHALLREILLFLEEEKAVSINLFCAECLYKQL